MELKDLKEYRDKVKKAQYEAGAKMFIDKLFHNFEINLCNYFIFYKFNNNIIAYYDKEKNYFFYDYSKIYQVLESEFGLNFPTINSYITLKVEEHLKIKNVISISIPLI